MKSYVVGLIFNDADRKRVMLIQKQRPLWQKGFLNGVGGEIEPGETPLAAVDRESGEECGLRGLHWQPLAVLQSASKGWHVHFFSAMVQPQFFYSAFDKTDERIMHVWVDSLSSVENLVPPLQVLIPLALTPGIVKPVILIDAGTPEMKT